MPISSKTVKAIKAIKAIKAVKLYKSCKHSLGRYMQSLVPSSCIRRHLAITNKKSFSFSM